MREAKPKMVVGRRALQKLAESAVVPAPHLAMRKPQRATDPPAQVQAVARHSATLAVVASDEPIAAGPVVHDERAAPPASPNIASKSQYRLDPAASAAGTPPAISRAVALKTPPIIALEVDQLAMPPACRLLLEGAIDELESAASAVAEQAKNGSQILALVSTETGAGCTTVALCLAQRLGSQGMRVCLVDGNFGHPHLAELVGLEPDCGLESVLSGKTTLGDVLIESLDDGLTLLPLCKPLRAEEIERAKLRHTVTLGALRDQFDVVLIDAGCAVASPGESNILDGGSIDAAILVGTAGGPRTTWDRARRAIEQSSVLCMGAIENRCK
jgi:Mrp family chromosome partitioning ATPase